MTKILYTKIRIGEQEIKLKPLYVGENASMTDYSNPLSEILIIKCEENFGELWISKSGIAIEHNGDRIVESDDLQLEKRFTDEYQRGIKTQFGDATLVLKFSNLSIN